MAQRSFHCICFNLWDFQIVLNRNPFFHSTDQCKSKRSRRRKTRVEKQETRSKMRQACPAGRQEPKSGYISLRPVCRQAGLAPLREKRRTRSSAAVDRLLGFAREKNSSPFLILINKSFLYNCFTFFNFGVSQILEYSYNSGFVHCPNLINGNHSFFSIMVY